MVSGDRIPVFDRSDEGWISCSPHFVTLNWECLAAIEYVCWVGHTRGESVALVISQNSIRNVRPGSGTGITWMKAEMNRLRFSFRKNQVGMFANDRVRVFNRWDQEGISRCPYSATPNEECLLAIVYLYSFYQSRDVFVALVILEDSIKNIRLRSNTFIEPIMREIPQSLLCAHSMAGGMSLTDPSLLSRGGSPRWNPKFQRSRRLASERTWSC